MKRKKIHRAAKKAAALLTAAVMTAAATTAVWAESSYEEAEKAVLDSFVASITENWDAQLKELKENSSAVNVTMDLKLEETTQQLLALLTGMDFSWLQNIALGMNTAVIDEMQGIDLNLQLNGSQILQFLELADMPGLEAYVKVPELFDGSIKTSLEVSGTTTAADGSTQEMSAEDAQELLTSVTDAAEFLPDAATTQEILNRYKDIVLAGMEDEQAPSEQELVIEGLSETCTLYEGRVYEKNFYSIAEEILNTAKEDEQLKAVIEKFGELSQETDLYAQFQESVDNGLASLAEDATEDAGSENYFFSKLWLDAEGNAAGRQIGMADATASVELFSWYSVQQDDKTALSVEFTDGEQDILLAGSGAVTEDGTMDGTYSLSYNGTPMVNIVLTDYTEGDGESAGCYTLSLDDRMTDQDTYSLFGLYQLQFNVKSSEADKSAMVEISLLQNEVSLGSLTFTTVYGENAETPEMGDLEPVYDVNVEEDGAAFAESLDWSPLLQKLTDAGMPEELVQTVDALIAGAVYGEDTTAEDGMEDVYDESGIDEAA